MTDGTDKRLERIEIKLDELAQAIVSLARVEERMLTLLQRMDHYDIEQRDLISRVTKLEQSVNSTGLRVGFGERLFWIIVIAVATAYIKGVIP